MVLNICLGVFSACLSLMGWLHHKHHKDIKGLSNTVACKSFPVCDHCGLIVGKYFIDGYGRTTCPRCKPEGYRDAVNRGTAKG